MTDLLLDRDTHDLVIVNGDLVLVDGIDLIRQRLKQRLLTVKGEWFLDVTIGLPYFAELSQKGITQSRVRSLFIAQIEGTEGVNRVTRLSLDFNSRTREIMLDFTVDTPFGPVEMMLP